jgi:hypothetical protein
MHVPRDVPSALTTTRRHDDTTTFLLSLARVPPISEWMSIGI